MTEFLRKISNVHKNHGSQECYINCDGCNFDVLTEEEQLSIISKRKVKNDLLKCTLVSGSDSFATSFPDTEEEICQMSHRTPCLF